MPGKKGRGAQERQKRSNKRIKVSSAMARDMKQAREILELRASGMGLEEIAEQCFITKDKVKRLLARTMKIMLKEPSEELRTLQHERLQRMLRIVWPMLEEGDLDAVDRALKIIDRICKLYGLDGPIKMDVITTNAQKQPYDPDRIRRISSMLMRAGAVKTIDGETVKTVPHRLLGEGKNGKDLPPVEKPDEADDAGSQN